MKLLAPASDIELIYSPIPGSYMHLWNEITWTWLIHWDLLCEPFKLRGHWVAAMRRPNV